MIATKEDAPLAAPHLENPSKPNTVFPPLSCDTHAHVFGPGRKYDFIESNLYFPSDALPQDYRHMLETVGFERAVLVQPSVYGTNNNCMLDAIALNPDCLRGVAVLPFNIEASALERLHGGGIRGVRINIVDLKRGAGVVDFDVLLKFAHQIAPLGWHIEFLMHVDEFPDLDQRLKDFPVDVCFGHFGYVPTLKGTKTPGFQALKRLMLDGKAWVKFSAPYRLTLSELPYEGVEECANELLQTAPNRLLYGSDWPHVRVKSQMPDDGALANLFTHWVKDEITRRKILVSNPARLYDFK